MEKKMSCDDVAGGAGQEEVEMDKFFELLAKLREARKRLRGQPSQVMKTTKSFDELYDNSIDDDLVENDNSKKRKVKSEGPSNRISSCWIGSFEKEDFFSCDRDYSTSPKGPNSNKSMITDDNCINEQRNKRHHDDKPLDGRLNLNLTL